MNLKYTILLFITLAKIQTTYGQENSDSIPLNSDVIISLESLDVLYIGLDNYIKISIPEGANPYDMGFGLKGATVMIDKQDSHYVSCRVQVGSKFADKDAFIYVYVKDKPIARKKVRIKFVPPPTISFGKLRSGFVLTKDLLQQEKVLVGVDIDYRGMRYDVTNYTFTLIRKKVVKRSIVADSIIYQVSGDTITAAIKECIRNAQIGDQIEISNVQAIFGMVGLVGIRNDRRLLMIIE